MKKKYPYGIPPFQSPDGWAKKPQVSKLINKDNKVIGIKVETQKEKFVIPVVDDPKRVKGMVNSGSKYLRPSYSLNGYSYQISRKKNL